MKRIGGGRGEETAGVRKSQVGSDAHGRGGETVLRRKRRKPGGKFKKPGYCIEAGGLFEDRSDNEQPIRLWGRRVGFR